MTYQCSYCTRTFATPYALKRHISDKHPCIDEDEGETSKPAIPYKEEPGLWDDNYLPIEETVRWDDLVFSTDDLMVRLR